MRIPDRYKDCFQFEFGDSPELQNELLGLVLEGKKTATCGALADCEPLGDEPMPFVGEVDVVRDGAGTPRAAIEITSVEVMKFKDVPEEFALAEGEGDFSQWREGHIAFFERNGGWSQDLELVCQRFKVVEVFADA